MPYPALTDMRMPYDTDGTLVYIGTVASGATTALTGTERSNLQRHAVGVSVSYGLTGTRAMWWFFPERREVSGMVCTGHGPSGIGQPGAPGGAVVRGSDDTANGSDGTWETASLPGGSVILGVTTGTPGIPHDYWRSTVRPISLTGPKQSLSMRWDGGNQWFQIHIYGEAAGGEMDHDLIFIDHDDTPGDEFESPEDFGDQPLGTTVVRQFRVKNVSASETATNVNLQCNDTDFAIATSPSGPWVATINIASLGPGVESNTMYVRCTTPAPGAPLGPRTARITIICDAGFFG